MFYNECRLTKKKHYLSLFKNYSSCENAVLPTFLRRRGQAETTLRLTRINSRNSPFTITFLNARLMKNLKMVIKISPPQSGTTRHFRLVYLDPWIRNPFIRLGNRTPFILSLYRLIKCNLPDGPASQRAIGNPKSEKYLNVQP